MSLQDSVELVEHAFLHAAPGDLFVKKAPASTVSTLARAVSRVLGHGEPEVRTIGMRHGEKMFETLLTREEVIQATDQGEYFRVPLDARALDYEVYVERGEHGGADARDYDSTTTKLLTVEETEQLLLTIPEMQHLADAASSKPGSPRRAS